MLEAFVYAIIVPLGVCAWTLTAAIVAGVVKYIFGK